MEQAIRKTVAGGSTSLYNVLHISLKELKKLPAREEQDVRREAIILLSDGEDTSSAIGFDDVMDLARRSETAIYPIGSHGRRGSYLCRRLPKPPTRFASSRARLLAAGRSSPST